ncbi:MAG: chalcone isomerase family protein [Thermodesulfobacteriota bacterium]|nr:chalcone isomerase family protein [Thermodesulfobacteriota bacterium]
MQSWELIPTDTKGLEFKKALFGIWLGDKPAQRSLKKEMLGR